MENSRRGRATEQQLQKYKDIVDGVTEPEGRGKDVLISEASHSGCIAPWSFLSPDEAYPEKLAASLAMVFEEVSKLTTEAQEIRLPALLLFAEDAALALGDEAACIKLVGSFFGQLVRTAAFVAAVNSTFRHFIFQLRAFYLIRKERYATAGDCPLTRAWVHLGELLCILIQLDEISTRRPAIRKAWKVFAKAIETAHHNPGQFDASPDSFPLLLTKIAEIDALIMAGNGLRNCYEQSYGDLDEDLTFASKFFNMVSALYSKWEKAAAEDIPDKKKLMVIVALATFYHLHFPKVNKKLIKNVWNCHRKVVVFHLMGDILWSPGEFMLKEVSDLKNIADKKSQTMIGEYRASMNDIALLDEAAGMLSEVSEWEYSLREEVQKSRTTDAATSLRIAELVLKGARLADTVSRLLKTILNCREGALRLSKNNVIKVFTILESVKSITILLKKHWRFLSENCQLACQQWRCHLLSLLDKARTVLRESGDVDRLTAVQYSVNALLHTASRSRLNCCIAGLEVSNTEKLLRASDVTQIEGLLTRLSTLSEPERLIQRVCDCSYVFYHRSLVDIYWETFLERMPSQESLNKFCAVLTDCAWFSSKSSHAPIEQESFFQYTWTSMKKFFLIPLSAYIENDLRVLTHKHLVVDERDKTAPEKSNFYIRLIKAGPLSIYDRMVDMKEFVSMYLEKTFYNLSAVVLHDFDTYNRMAEMARIRYGMQLTPGDLPPCCIDQGLDVIHVIRSLHHFVSHYNYCINQQFFIEKFSSNRTLRVVTSEHMTSSLRTHGTGILNTSVNIVYQLLRKKFAILSQFLADEHIRAQLQRDQRYFNENREELKQMYPSKRAERFNRALAKLDSGEAGSTFVDKFRELVTQIGNAISFVRSMTSAASAISWQVKAYTFGEEDLREEIGEANAKTACLNAVLTDIREQTTRNRNYIKMLLDVFRSGFADGDKFAHLQLFHMVVPPLTLNYLEHMLRNRERLKKRTIGMEKEMTFIDDGFVMGIAYLLAVFSQWRDFNLLGWMASLRQKFEQEVSELNSELSQSKDKRSEKLRVDRVTDCMREFQQMVFSFQSARVFFSYDGDDE